ncbi:Hsp20/alpha crystallin family protein [Gimesia fumaroli]|jgi:HSP20 family protein|uniref:Spore protein SP21 n=1 Tax=Gimesia fumaroli TaxID=2527976 RepID=A0A518IKD6_9PLAN|nr:Hsp20/alpha crystallin family protein [Gimesia fumaroli]QDV53567.1 Spore protein SP21 [Gimesia fumaroli]
MSTAENHQADPEPVHVSTEEEAGEQPQAEQTEQSETSGAGAQKSIDRLRTEFDKLLGIAVEQGERALDKLGLFGNEAVWMPRVDLLEQEEQVQVYFDLPGVTAEEINITLAGNMLTVTGTRSTGTTTTTGQTVRMSERPSGQFRRSVPMPVAVDPDKVTASVQNGILSVLLEKSSTEKPRQIPINSASGAGFAS